MTNPELKLLNDGPIDFARIEREAHRLRAEAMRKAARDFGVWLRAHLRHRRRPAAGAAARA